MAKNVGRNFVIKRAGTTIAAARTKTITINNEAIDVTTDDDSGFRTLLEEPGQKQIDLSVEGLTDNDDLISKAANGTSLIDTYTLEFPSGATIEGDFRFNSLEVGAEYNAAATFTAEIQSTGAYTYTAAP
mgnify:CR=1 FL=1